MRTKIELTNFQGFQGSQGCPIPNPLSLADIFLLLLGVSKYAKIGISRILINAVS